MKCFAPQRVFGLTIILGIWTCWVVPVVAQEAYYWSYAQHPDLSYYDHPPMVAWLIWLGTSVLGDGPLGIRIMTLLCGLGVTLTGLAFLKHFGANRKACLAWVVMGFGVPMYAVLHVLANPDPMLCLAWGLTMLFVWRARSGKIGWWVAAGVAAGIGLLSKYSAAFLAVGIALVLIVDPVMRRQLRSPGPWLGALSAAICFLPVIMWNVGNDFESFRFQTSGRYAKADFGFRWFGQCVAGQLGVMNPGLVLLLPFVIRWLWQRARSGDARATWLLAFGLPMPLFWVTNSLFIQVKINWFLPAYLPLYLGTLLWWTEGGGAAAKPRLCSIAKWSVIVAVVLVFAAPAMRLIPQRRGSSWSGWDQIALAAERWRQATDRLDAQEGDVFFFGADYKDSSQLHRSLKLTNGGHLPAPVLAQNVRGAPALQFDHWDAPSSHKGEDAIFVLARPDRRVEQVALMGKHFRSMERKERVEIVTLGIHVLEADIYVCRGYLGP